MGKNDRCALTDILGTLEHFITELGKGQSISDNIK